MTAGLLIPSRQNGTISRVVVQAVPFIIISYIHGLSSLSSSSFFHLYESKFLATRDRFVPCQDAVNGRVCVPLEPSSRHTVFFLLTIRRRRRRRRLFFFPENSARGIDDGRVVDTKQAGCKQTFFGSMTKPNPTVSSFFLLLGSSFVLSPVCSLTM